MRSPGVRPWMLVSAAWIIPAVLGAVNQIAQRRLAGEPPPPTPELLFAGGDWLLYALLTPAVFAVSRRWPIARPRLARPVAIHLGVSLAFCAAWAAAGTALRAVLTPSALYYQPAKYFVSWLFITFPFGVAVYLCVVGVEHAIRYFVEARDRDLQVARISAQLSTARLAALEARINPHFLFNTLNTIAVLVRDDNRSAAVRIVEQLGDVLRRTLAPRRASEVTLAEELELVRQYLAIEQARFSDRLHATFAVDGEALAAALPGFALQHLVENAVRHGIARRSTASRVDVRAFREADALVLTVADDGLGIEPGAADAPGRGIAQTRDRLRALYRDRASLTVSRAQGGGTVATLRVPYHVLAVEQDNGAR